MPGGVRTIPAASAKQVVLCAMVDAGARVGRPTSAARIARRTGPHHDVAAVTTILDSLVTDGTAANTGGNYALTTAGLTAHRLHPYPRKRYTAY